MTENDADVLYAKLNASDFDEVLEFILNHFINSETISQSISLDSASTSVRHFYGDLVTSSITSPASFLARTTDGHLIGVQLAEIVTAKEYDQRLEHFFGYDYPDQQLMILVEFMKYIFNRLDPDYTLIGIKKTNIFKLILVREDRRRRGIGRRLTQLSLEASKSNRCDSAFVIATGFQSQCLYRCMNFNSVLEIAYSKFYGEYKEQPIVPKNGSELCQVLMFNM